MLSNELIDQKYASPKLNSVKPVRVLLLGGKIQLIAVLVVLSPLLTIQQNIQTIELVIYSAIRFKCSIINLDPKDSEYPLIHPTP